MTTNIANSKSFEEKMKDRIKDSIGDLITDDELTKIVNRYLEDIFFKPRTISDGSYRTKEIPPYLHEIIKELMNDRIHDIINKYIEDHKEEVEKAIKEVISLGIGDSIIKALDYKFKGDLNMFTSNIMNTISNR